MRRLLSAMFLSAALGGCALLIKLGDEPGLLPAEDGGADTSAIDSGADVVDVVDAAPSLKCRLRPSPDPACRACIERSCCEVSTACSADPACNVGIECIKDCLGSIPCITGCLASSTTELQALADCSGSQCTRCTPEARCKKLGQCCFQLADSGVDMLFRSSCAGAILDLDEDKCDAKRKEVADHLDASGDPCR